MKVCYIKYNKIIITFMIFKIKYYNPWEGVGICSYLLVNFWFTRIAANQSSISAFLTNRVGDCFLTIGMFILLWSFGNINYSTIFSLAPYINQDIITLIGICLLIGAMAKSSQIGLHVWLPQAMEGLLKNGLSLNFTICENNLRYIGPLKKRFLLGKIQYISQFARNFMGSNKRVLSNNLKHKYSSETIREINNCDIYLIKLDDKFKFWFIGFAEGDGSFSIYKKRYLEFKITQSSQDAQILFYIKKQLGFGSVSIQSIFNKTHHYRVRDKKGILTLIKIFNGNIQTKSKNVQFKEWISAYNKIYNKNIVFIDNKNDISLYNSWLSGFTDAEGCFTVSIIKNTKYNSTQVTVRYILSQKGEFELLNKISLLIGGKVHLVKSYNGHNMVVNLTKLKTIINYFTHNKLKTKKYINYCNWLKVYNLVITKEHLTESGLIKVKILKDKINKKVI